MNENPEGTPNPLNPVDGTPENEQEHSTVEKTEGETPSETVSEAEKTQPASDVASEAEQKQAMPEPLEAEPVPEPISIETFEDTTSNETSSDEKTPDSNNAETPEPVQLSEQESITTEEVVASTTPEPINTPTPEPVVVPTQKTAKGRKGALIVGIICLVVAVVAGVTAAIIAFNPFGKTNDAVPSAIAKLLNKEAPSKIAIDGTVSVNSAEAYSPYKSLTVSFNGGVNAVSGESYGYAHVSASLPDDNEFGFDLDELHTTDDAYYLRLSGVYSELTDYYDNQNINQSIVDCASVTGSASADGCTPNCVDSSDLTNCVQEPEPTLDLRQYIDVFDVIDNEWILIKNSDLSSLTEMTTIDNPGQCLINAADKLAQYGSDFADLYKKYPFITYSTEGIMSISASTLKSGEHAYHLSFDADKMVGFVNALPNTGFANELLACMGFDATNVGLKKEDAEAIISALPNTEVKIDENNNFTRLFMSVFTQDGSSAVIDLNFKYPENISVTLPTEYIDFNAALSKILSKFMQQSIQFDNQSLLDLGNL